MEEKRENKAQIRNEITKFRKINCDKANKRNLETTVAARPASKAVQSKNIWNESEMSPKLLVQTP